MKPNNVLQASRITVNNIILFEHALVIKMFFSWFALKLRFARGIGMNHASHLPPINMLQTHAKFQLRFDFDFVRCGFRTQ